ncbi:MAG: catalase/peroxidase HPI [Polyangiaceae bacterium]|jgi:catalase-peroxidase|nr:catalase/peroxidase HPI [Polyangiaceae bacterium]
MRSATRFPSLLLTPSAALLLVLPACQPSPSVAVGVPAQPVASPETSAALVAGTGPTEAARDGRSWWPDRVDLTPLRRNEAGNARAEARAYAEKVAKLDLKAVKADIEAVMTRSQDWWPADYGTYGPLFIRMAWHSAGTYRVFDGRGGADGGQQRFEPLNSWPDNGNLDKARRLLLPVKQKYGSALSWADLMILAGNVAMERGGFKTLGFAAGRVDDREAELVDWGPERKFLAAERFHGKRELEKPLAATQMGLIYVNPEGPDGKPDPVAAASDIRETFARMGMNDEETVALIAGGHTFGKAHGAHPVDRCVGKEPAALGMEAQGLGWVNSCGTGKGADTTTSGLEGAWTSTPTRWSGQYFAFLYGFTWEKTKSPAGATQWKPQGDAGASLVPDAHDATKRHAPMMLTTDLSLRQDPAYDAVSKRFKDDPEAFARAFAHAWFKLTHRDLGPKTRYLGSEVPRESFVWQDPIPAIDYKVVEASDINQLRGAIVATGLRPSELVRVAWASASTYRASDMRGGANGARIRLEPAIHWKVNDPAELRATLGKLEEVRSRFNASASGGKRVSLADVIVLAGAVGIEQAAKAAGAPVAVPFTPGRNDATAEQTDVTSFGFLEPKADGFRNHHTEEAGRRPTDALIDKAAQLGLTTVEMTALVGGLRVLDANSGGSRHGVFTRKPGTLSNDFFVNLLDLSTRWTPKGDGTFEGTGPDGKVRWTATQVDLVFGSNAELRAICEGYAHDRERFEKDFVAAWTKVMLADRFDLHR